MQGNKKVNIELDDDGLEDLITMTGFCDDEDEDADSIIAPSEISFFTDSEDDDMRATASSDGEINTLQKEETVFLAPCSSDNLQVLLMNNNEIPETDLNTNPVIQKVTSPFLHRHQ